MLSSLNSGTFGRNENEARSSRSARMSDIELSHNTSSGVGNIKEKLLDDSDSGYLKWTNLFDKDDGKRRRARIICCSVCCAGNLILWLPLTFCVFIPIIIQQMVNHSSMNVVEAHIVNPTNKSFQSSVEVQFGSTGGLPAKMRLKSLTLSWNGAGGGDISTLSNSNTVSIKSHEIVTISSVADVINATALENFNAYAVKAKTVTWNMAGTARIMSIIDCNVHLNKQVTLNGYNNFSIPPTVGQINVTQGTPYYLYNAITATLTSQSTVALSFGQNLNFYLYYNNTRFARGYMPNATMDVGTFSVNTVSMLYSKLSGTPEEYAAAMALQSNYVCGLPSVITMEYFYLTDTVSWMVKSLETMTMTATLPPISSSLLLSLNMKINLLDLLKIPFSFTVHNSFGVPLIIQNYSGNVTYYGVPIASISETLQNITIPPYSTVTTKTYDCKGSDSVAALDALDQLLKSPDPVLNVTALLGAYIQDYEISLPFFQYNVPANITCTPTVACNK